MERKQITVYIVEDSPDVRDALVDLLGDVEDVDVVGSAENAPNAISGILRARPDFVVLDYQLIDSNAVDVLRAVHPVLPETSFIVLTNHANKAYERVCTAAGAGWFLQKNRDFAKVKDIVAHLAAPHA